MLLCGDVMHILYLLAILLATLLQGIVDACGRTPAKPKPTSSPPLIETTTSTSTVVSHRKPCTDAEVNAKGCLNGGECFAINLGGNRTLSCNCPKLYTGHRCQEISPDLFGELQAEEKVLTASIAAGVSVLVILLTMGIVYAVVRVKRKRNRQEFDSQDEADGMTDEDKKFKPLITNHLITDIQNCNRETKV